MFHSVWPTPELPEGNFASFLLQSKYLTAQENQLQPLYTDGLSNDSLSVSQYRTLVPGASSYFRASLGLKKGSVAILFGENTIWTGIIHMATLWLGGIVSPANMMYNSEELAHQIKLVQPRVIFVGEGQEQVVKDAFQLTKTDCKIITFKELAKELRRIDKRSILPRAEPVNSRDHAYYCMSSGTSGLSKAVILTHGNISSNVAQQVAMKSPFQAHDLSVCAVLPLTHILGLNVHIFMVPYFASRCVVLPKFSLENLLKTVAKYEIRVIYLVPPIILALSQSELLDKYPGFAKSVRYILSAAAPLSRSLVERLSLRAPNIHFFQLYGLTETAPFTHFGGRDESYEIEKIGWLVPGTEARLVDPETQTDLNELGRPGELWIRGPQVMLGYLHNAAGTASTFEDEWFKTGDVVVVDETGQFQIVDRIKELIKSKGHQVAPAELESILLTNPLVLDVAVIGVPDDHGSTELPRAFVVAQKNADPLEILTWFNQRVARHKRLWGGIVVTGSIPKSPAGKILRRLLRDRKDDVVVLAPANKI